MCGVNKYSRKTAWKERPSPKSAKNSASRAPAGLHNGRSAKKFDTVS